MFACREDEDDADEVGLCQNVMEGLETIDGLLDEHGIVMVMTTELDRARELWIRRKARGEAAHVSCLTASTN